MPTTLTEGTNTWPRTELSPNRSEKNPDVGVLEYTATPLESNRSKTVMLKLANISALAVPNTVNVTVHIASGPLAVSLLVCGDEGDAVMATS